MSKSNPSYHGLAAAGITAAVLGGALLAWSLAHWRGTPAEQVAAWSAPSAAPVLASQSPRIGIGTPLTGAGATHGIQLKAGVERAVEDINAAGGVLGQKLATTVGDDRSDSQEGVSVARRFAGDGLKFVVGHISTAVTLPASDVYLEHGILAITPAATNPRVTERNMWNIFRTCGRDDQQGLVAGEYILKNFKGQKIAIVHDKTTYGQGLADVTRATINKGGMKDVLYEGVNVGGRDYSALASRIKASGADLVYWGGLYDPGAMILRQMRDQGVKATLMGGDGIADHQLAAIAGAAAEGTLLTYGPDPRKRPQAKDVVAKFRAKNFDPMAATLYSYAAVEIIKQAAEAAKSLDPKKVAEQMTSGMTFNTVLGDISYDKKGDVTRLDYVVYVWKKDAGGKITYAEIE